MFEKVGGFFRNVFKKGLLIDSLTVFPVVCLANCPGYAVAEKHNRVGNSFLFFYHFSL